MSDPRSHLRSSARLTVQHHGCSLCLTGKASHKHEMDHYLLTLLPVHNQLSDRTELWTTLELKPELVLPGISVTQHKVRPQRLQLCNRGCLDLLQLLTYGRKGGFIKCSGRCVMTANTTAGVVQSSAKEFPVL